MHGTGCKRRLVAALICTAWMPAAVAAEIAAARQAEVLYLLKQDCGSCHGLTLKGGLGPALTPQALAGKAPAMLREVILHGRPGTPMPPWKTFLTADEADWLVRALLEGRTDAR